jgi:hypothetical protein
VARTTTSGASARTRSAVARTPVRTATPARAHSAARSSTSGRNPSRPGADAATRIAPPVSLACSQTVTACPRAAAVAAARSPAGPPPTTSTRRRRSGSGSGASRPARGLVTQPSGRLRPTRPTHSWLQPRQRRTSPSRPVSAFAANSGSAICARTAPTRSQSLIASARSACAGVRKRPTPTTGTSTAARIAAERYRA